MPKKLLAKINLTIAAVVAVVAFPAFLRLKHAISEFSLH
jgi:hypothetical protein